MTDDPIVFADADEARAWDGYAAAVLPLDHVHAWARVAEWADAMLRERRKRVPCPHYVRGADGGVRQCRRGLLHEGGCQP